VPAAVGKLCWAPWPDASGTWQRTSGTGSHRRPCKAARGLSLEFRWFAACATCTSPPRKRVVGLCRASGDGPRGRLTMLSRSRGVACTSGQRPRHVEVHRLAVSQALYPRQAHATSVANRRRLWPEMPIALPLSLSLSRAGLLLATGALVVATGAVSLYAQGQAASVPAAATFDVASVKPVAGGGSSFSIETQPGGTLRAENVSVRTLILDAFRVQESQLVQLPTWAASERFTIAARAGRPASDAQLWAMMRTLLEERFRLRVHTEERQGSVYFLELSRSDRSLGPKLLAVNRDCSIDSPAPPAQPARTPGFCGMDANTGGPRESLRGGAQTMAQLANALGTYAVPRPVIDRTGLVGTFDFTVQWAREPQAGAASLTDDVSILTALPEQLGLRLEGGRGPVQVLVVDNLERPTPD
jgi:uncharacterized protein (TIGR03435 family)